MITIKSMALDLYYMVKGNETGMKIQKANLRGNASDLTDRRLKNREKCYTSCKPGLVSGFENKFERTNVIYS